MPRYLYADAHGHRRELSHRMLYTTGIVCFECGDAMHRVPQAPRINWNGNRAGYEPAPAVQELINTAPERKDKFLEMKEQHERDGVTKFTADSLPR
jgi:hypothetical protein